MEIRPPKYASERTVYIPDRLITLLAEHVRRYRPGDDPDRWLFPGSRDATATRPRGHGGAVLADCSRCCGDRRNRLHDLRHFYASGLIRAGCDVVTIQRTLGHSSAAITLVTYSHLWPDANDRTRKAAGELLEASLSALLRTHCGLRA